MNRLHTLELLLQGKREQHTPAHTTLLRANFMLCDYLDCDNYLCTKCMHGQYGLTRLVQRPAHMRRMLFRSGFFGLRTGFEELILLWMIWSWRTDLGCFCKMLSLLDWQANAEHCSQTKKLPFHWWPTIRLSLTMSNSVRAIETTE